MVRRVQVVLGLATLFAAAFVATSSGQGPPGGSPPGLDKAIAAKQKHALKMLDKPGVAGIGVGVNRAGKAVIHVYKEKDDTPDIPDELDGVEVEGVTSGVIVPRAPTDRFPRPVPIGVSSGHYELATGTLGARVTNGTNVFALSNNHVFAGINSASIGDAILQPGPIEDGGTDPADRIATLADYQVIDFEGGLNTMDAAIAATTPGDVGTATPLDGYGSPSSTTVPASIGLPVQKYGRTTGFQLGSVADINLSVDVCYLDFFGFCLQEARFVNQISITPGPFSAPGDSGSLVVTQGANQPVGLLFAGGDGLTIANPIDVVLQRFNVTIDGSPPQDGPPGAPTALGAVPGDGQVALSWNAPAFDGGSPITGYKVYRGTSPNPTNVLATLGVQTSYQDASAANGTTYYYRVSALNLNGEGSTSNEASATPLAAVAPSPLPAPLDTFNRPNEDPLSDAGRWSNGIIGGESGHTVNTNQLACKLPTTCTAWRNNAQYGPDVEVWARIATLPGVGNVIRLNVRLQNPVSSPTGYLIRASQTTGTDQIWVERFDNGLAVTRLIVSRELAVGDTLLLRAKGSAIELWLHDGTVWSRLGFFQDSTYANAGYVGVGLRGTTGRLDDFGARTLGGPPPDTEAPSAPGALAASAVSPGQIDLTWGAATDNVGVALYRIERCQGAGCSNFAEIATTATTSFQNTGLSPSTSYTYRVRAEDTVPNLGPFGNEATATTQDPPDTEAPSAPGTLTASAFSSSQIELSWGAATDNVGVTAYRIERCAGSGCSDFAQIAMSTSTNHMDVSLSPSTSYSYRVRAEDAIPNIGPFGNTASATTLAPPDTEAPSAPGLLTATAVSSSQIDLGWGAATDNVAVTLYRIERCSGAGCSDFAEIAATASTSFQNTGLNASTSYSFRVRAEDAVPNLGPHGNTASATTQAPPDTEAPSAPGTLIANAVSSSQINLGWGAATDNVGVTLYRIERCQGTSCANFSEIATTSALSYADSGLTASTSYSYRVRAQDAAPNVGPFANLASATTLAPARPLFFSLLSDGTVGGVSAANEDVISYDGASTFSVVFDGSDVGLGSRRLDAFGWLDADSLLFSLESDGATLAGVGGTIDDSDVIRFDAISLGATTSGAFSMYFDGSDVGLTSSGEDVDAFELLANGTIVLSTEGSAGVPGVSAADEDLLVFTPTTLGPSTAGSYAMYFDGSDVGLSSSGENVDAAAVDATGRIYLSTTGNFSVTGASGADEDVFVFTPTTLGASTTGSYSASLYFDGSVLGFGGNDVSAIDLPPGA